MKNILFLLLMFSTFLLAFEPNEYLEANKEEIVKFTKELTGNMSKVESLAFAFTQTKELKLFEDSIQMEGRCYIKKPARIYWEYSSPIKKIITWSDGEIQVFKKNGSSNKIIQVKVTPWEEKSIKIVYGYILAFFSGQNFHQLEDNFFFVLKKNEEGYLLVFKAKDSLKKIIQEIQMKVDKECKAITQVSIIETNGDSTKMDFHSFQENPKSDLFLGLSENGF